MFTTCRFNDETWQANCEYRERLDHAGCLYGVPMKVTHTIPLNTILFVIEMNNARNKIMGIGLIRNMIEPERFNIYQTELGNYNRYVYKGENRLDREFLLEHNPKLVEIFDYILFKEKTHLKRGSGFIRVPVRLLTHEKCEGIDLKEEITNLFKK